ncbi:MAG: BrnA antitoxin family protein [Magnetococcales bacterium]|nr:BrnA antitoxin family protein [Magnetococcales bacterium]
MITAFRATGKGWQTRMNDALADWLKDFPYRNSRRHRSL